MQFDVITTAISATGAPLIVSGVLGVGEIAVGAYQYRNANKALGHLNMIAGGLASPDSPENTIQEQMRRDTQRQQAERLKIRLETETKIFELQQDITLNRAKTTDKAFKKWSDYIKG